MCPTRLFHAAALGGGPGGIAAVTAQPANGKEKASPGFPVARSTAACDRSTAPPAGPEDRIEDQGECAGRRPVSRTSWNGPAWRRPCDPSTALPRPMVSVRRSRNPSTTKTMPVGGASRRPMARFAVISHGRPTHPPRCPPTRGFARPGNRLAPGRPCRPRRPAPRWACCAHRSGGRCRPRGRTRP